jgi:hypothetical protein
MDTALPAPEISTACFANPGAFKKIISVLIYQEVFGEVF